MLSFVIRYRAAINAIIVDKSLKLWKFELDEEWNKCVAWEMSVHASRTRGGMSHTRRKKN
jgi:hypothetical protein